MSSVCFANQQISSGYSVLPCSRSELSKSYIHWFGELQALINQKLVLLQSNLYFFASRTMKKSMEEKKEVIFRQAQQTN